MNLNRPIHHLARNTSNFLIYSLKLKFILVLLHKIKIKIITLDEFQRLQWLQQFPTLKAKELVGTSAVRQCVMNFIYFFFPYNHLHFYVGIREFFLFLWVLTEVFSDVGLQNDNFLPSTAAQKRSVVVILNKVYRFLTKEILLSPRNSTPNTLLWWNT